MQGVIAEYERAKFAERERRGKLYRARAGEVLSRKVPYGYRRVPRGPAAPAHLIVHEAEAAVVRRIFADHTGGASIRGIALALAGEGVPSPEGKTVWPLATIGRLLRNEAYVGRLYWNRTATSSGPGPRASPPAAPASGGVGDDPHPGHRRRGDLRGGRTGGPGQRRIQPAPDRARHL